MIVRLMGGLGNQLFGYAFGRSVSLRKGVSLEFQFLESGSWPYSLKPFNMDVNLVPFNRLRNSFYREKTFAFDKDAYTAGDSLVYFGYWQTEKYFNEPVIRRELTFKEAPGSMTLALGEEFQKNINTVSVHVRRGDYLKVRPDAILPMTYYNRAFAEMKCRISNAEFFIFSDDINWCKENFYGLSSKYPITYVSYPGSNQHDDLYLMSKCHHSIIANSSFSWWGAYLAESNYNYNRVTIAPANWFDSKTNLDSSDVIPERWIKI